MNIQDSLTEMQATTAFGPLVISPIKIVVSTVEIIVNLALAILLSLGAVLAFFVSPSTSGELLDYSGRALVNFFVAWGSMALAILNLGTLGIAGAIYNTFPKSTATNTAG